MTLFCFLFWSVSNINKRLFPPSKTAKVFIVFCQNLTLALRSSFFGCIFIYCVFFHMTNYYRDVWWSSHDMAKQSYLRLYHTISSSIGFASTFFPLHPVLISYFLVCPMYHGIFISATFWICSCWYYIAQPNIPYHKSISGLIAVSLNFPFWVQEHLPPVNHNNT